MLFWGEDFEEFLAEFVGDGALLFAGGGVAGFDGVEFVFGVVEDGGDFGFLVCGEIEGVDGGFEALEDACCGGLLCVVGAAVFAGVGGAGGGSGGGWISVGVSLVLDHFGEGGVELGFLGVVELFADLAVEVLHELGHFGAAFFGGGLLEFTGDVAEFAHLLLHDAGDGLALIWGELECHEDFAVALEYALHGAGRSGLAGWARSGGGVLAGGGWGWGSVAGGLGGGPVGEGGGEEEGGGEGESGGHLGHGGLHEDRLTERGCGS